jgi:CheY-like chemotaxis protein
VPLLFILEDTPADLRKAADIAQSVGFTEVEISRFASDAQSYLKKAMSGNVSLPDAIVIDLDLGIESGFELLRFWHGTPLLRPIPVIIWTGMGDHQREICELFGVYKFVLKGDGPQPLSETLSSVIAGATQRQV